MVKMLMAAAGLESERLRLEWVSAAEGQRFAQVVTEFTEQIKKLGPSPVSRERPNQQILENLQAAKNAASSSRLRVLVGRERELTEKSNVYEEKVSQEEFDALLRDAAETEFIRHKIYLLTKDRPFSVKDLAKVVSMKPPDVLCHIVNMRRRGMITLDHVEGTTPFYKAIEAK
jgi:predicted Rossmann fold nucleotide-binding protein DprA/Smf involved in DNA uptake